MKEYVLILHMRTTLQTDEELNNLRKKWGAVIPTWRQQGIYVSSNILFQKGAVLSGIERTIETGAIERDGLMVGGTVNIMAASLEAAVELAKACPPLDLGGSVEVREMQPRPGTNNN